MSGSEPAGGWPAGLLSLLAAEAERPVPEDVLRLGAAATAEVGPAALAVLFYGSALREASVEGKLVDLYVIVDAYERLKDGPLLRRLVRLVPPNVYYLETAGTAGTVRAKYAVVSLDQLAQRCGRATENPYFWARFAQPTAILPGAAPAVRQRLVAAFAAASDAVLAKARPLLPQGAPAGEVWGRAFRETYRTELRSEPSTRGFTIYEAAPARYDAVAALLAGRPPEPGTARDAMRAWRRRRRMGKLLSVLRLVKASFTFVGGADYIAWKVERHSGVKVELSDWQRRHPLLAAPALLWRLRRQRAIR
ncbi:MAG: hypothetical protein U1E14_09195 [Geminicoccaceae bacterium]